MVPSKSTHADQFLGHRDPLPLSHSSGVSRGAASQRSPNRACCPGPGSTLDSDRKSTRLNSRHAHISYAVFFFKKKKRIRSAAIRYVFDTERTASYHSCSQL